MSGHRFIAAVLLPVMGVVSVTSVAQMPLEPPSKMGLTVTPVFEGWYRNPDGTASLSFGYYNRNYEEVLEIPIGPDNFFEPGPANRGQPTHFQPRRHWGVFAITVPADFGYGRLVWTVKIRGETYFVPGSLNRDWEIDALNGEAGSGNTPPVVSFHSGGPEGTGPAGVTGGPISAKAGMPAEVTVWASDDGRGAGSVFDEGEEGIPVNLAWFKHQGPGDVSFSVETHEVSSGGAEAKTMATFSQPGSYVLRVRANDASGVVSVGHAQCCWTNGFVTVNVAE